MYHEVPNWISPYPLCGFGSHPKFVTLFARRCTIAPEGRKSCSLDMDVYPSWWINAKKMKEDSPFPKKILLFHGVDFGITLRQEAGGYGSLTHPPCLAVE